MFDNSIKKQLENMLNQMSASQKNKLENLIKDEDSLKKAIADIDPQKVKQVAETLPIHAGKDLNVEALIRDLKQHPDKIKDLEKKL